MFEQNEFKNLIRTILQAEYLLVTLVLLYLVFPGVNVENKQNVILVTAGYIVFLTLYHFIFSKQNTNIVLSGKVFISAIFISVVVWYTGKAGSPLLNLYLVTVISTAILLPRFTTALLILFITTCLMLFDFYEYGYDLFTAQNAMIMLKQLVNFAMLCLIAYLVNMLTMHMQDAKDQIRNVSELDTLTGLLNRRAFTNILYKSYKRYVQYSGNLSIMMVDIDNLKTINDEYGRVIGDRLLALIGGSIKRSIKENDLVARYGSDEFIVMLAETGSDSAFKTAERIREGIESMPLIIEGGKEVFATVSIGITCYPETKALDELINRADLAMYESKEGGKNRTTVYAEIFAERNDELAVDLETEGTEETSLR